MLREIGVETRRLQRAVRDQPGQWPHDRHRNEPACVAFFGAYFKATGFPVRQGRGQAPSSSCTLDELDSTAFLAVRRLPRSGRRSVSSITWKSRVSPSRNSRLSPIRPPPPSRSVKSWPSDTFQESFAEGAARSWKPAADRLDEVPSNIEEGGEENAIRCHRHADAGSSAHGRAGNASRPDLPSRCTTHRR